MAVDAHSFKLVNPYALASISEASETIVMRSSEDILDDHGVKLWSRGQPISRSLHERLLARKLQRPLESCLQAEGGITVAHLFEQLSAFVASGHPIAKMVQPNATQLLQEVKFLPLHSVVQLMLTAGAAARPSLLEHAVRGMALAGAMQASVGGGRQAIRLAMLGGLLHDLGEMYVNPDYLDGQQALDLNAYRHLVTHPRLGALLLSSLTDYPAELALGVSQHHERMDGSGYPARLQGPAISPLGRLLAVVEVILGATADGLAPVTRSSLLLRMIPGEFDTVWIDYVAKAAGLLDEPLAGLDASRQAEESAQVLEEVCRQLSQGLSWAQTLCDSDSATPGVKEIAEHAAARLGRLLMGWNSIGLWSVVDDATRPDAQFEVHAAQCELCYRLKTLRRDCLWRYPQLPPEDSEQLSPLWQSLCVG